MARPKGSTFRKHFDLERRQPIDEFVSKMAQGMCEASLEVLVIAFCRDATVFDCRANIGYKTSTRRYRFDNWIKIATENNCNEVRSYHNHPGIFSWLGASYSDSYCHRLASSFLRPAKIDLRSFIIKSRFFKGWKIREYSDKEWKSLLDARKIGLSVR